MFPGVLTGGFVQYAEVCGLGPDARGVEHRVYTPRNNLTLKPGYKDAIIQLSEQRRKAELEEGYIGIDERSLKMLESEGY